MPTPTVANSHMSAFKFTAWTAYGNQRVGGVAIYSSDFGLTARSISIDGLIASATPRRLQYILLLNTVSQHVLCAVTRSLPIAYDCEKLFSHGAIPNRIYIKESTRKS